MTMTSFTEEQSLILNEAGFIPGWTGDIKQGDCVVLDPSLTTSFIDPEREEKMKKLSFWTIVSIDSQEVYRHDEMGRVIGSGPSHSVISLIGVREDGASRHFTMHDRYPCYYKREQAETELTVEQAANLIDGDEE